MGIFSRIRRKKAKSPKKEGGLPKEGSGQKTVGEPAPPPRESGGLPKKEGSAVVEETIVLVEPQGANEQALKALKAEEERKVKEAVERAAPVETVEIAEDKPQKQGSFVTRFLKKLAEQSDHRNWSPNSVGEKVFATRSEANAFAREMRALGYRAKVVRLKDGIYKVYLYRGRRGSASFGFDMRGMKTFKFDIGLSGRGKKKNPLESFKLDLGGLDEFKDFKLDLKGLEDFKF